MTMIDESIDSLIAKGLIRETEDGGVELTEAGMVLVNGDAIDSLIAKGLIRETEDGIELTEAGQMVVNRTDRPSLTPKDK